MYILKYSFIAKREEKYNTGGDFTSREPDFWVNDTDKKYLHAIKGHGTSTFMLYLALLRLLKQIIVLVSSTTMVLDSCETRIWKFCRCEQGLICSKRTFFYSGNSTFIN